MAAAFIIPIFNLLDRLLPDKAANDKAKSDLLTLAQTQEGQQIIAQLQVNLAEAENPSVFVAGWRPFIGWSCGFAFIYQMIVYPSAEFLFQLWHHQELKFPALDTSTLITILFAMLGLGTLRTLDKYNGTETNSMGQK